MDFHTIWGGEPPDLCESPEKGETLTLDFCHDKKTALRFNILPQEVPRPKQCTFTFMNVLALVFPQNYWYFYSWPFLFHYFEGKH